MQAEALGVKRVALQMQRAIKTTRLEKVQSALEDMFPDCGEVTREAGSKKGSTTTNEDVSILEMMLLQLAGGNAARASEALLKVIGKCDLIEGEIGLKLGEKVHHDDTVIVNK